ncbi:MAG TPA: hypothetical protein PKO11_09575 [Bacteroidales bacterium]|nr:hypothetical protein [Bacteroidales bacterium]
MNCSQSGDFVRDGGAEMFGTEKKVDYYPTQGEVFKYWEGCRDLLLEWIKEDLSIVSLVATIVENHCIRWCRDGFIDSMLTLVNQLADKKENNWPELYEKLVRNMEYFRKKMSQRAISLIDNLISQLKPQDFVSQVLMFRYEGDIDYRKHHDEVKKCLEAKFQPIVNEFFDSGLYGNYSIIHDLCVSPDFVENYFCVAVTKRASDEQSVELLRTIIDVINKEEGSNLKYFFFGICNALRNSKFFFDFTREILVTGHQDLYVHILAYCEDDKLTSFTRLQKDFVAEILEPDYICSYLRNIGCCNNEMMKQIIEAVREVFPDRSRELLDFVRRFNYLPDVRKDTELFPLYKKIILDYPIVTEYRNDNYEYSRFTVGLLKNDNDTEFAKKLSDKLIEAMNQDYLYNNFEGLWSVLLEKYFLVVWEDFSKALVSKDYIRFRYQVRHEIGSGFGFGSGPIFSMGDEVIKKFCFNYPIEAPSLVANLCPVFAFEKLGDGSIRTERFSDIALWLFDEFGDKEEVLDAFHANLCTLSWTGSIIPYHERNIACFKLLLNHKRVQVREWAEKSIKYEEERLQHEIDREDYIRMHYN